MIIKLSWSELGFAEIGFSFCKLIVTETRMLEIWY